MIQLARDIGRRLAIEKKSTYEKSGRSGWCFALLVDL